MNGAHWHLILNHLPLIFPMVGIIILILGFITKSEPIARTAFLIFILGALASISAMATGEGAEDVVEKLGSETQNFIKVHEHAAETFATFSYIFGLSSLIALWASFKNKSFSHILSIAILCFSLIIIYFAKQVGTTGGEIRHVEIRSDNKK